MGRGMSVTEEWVLVCAEQLGRLIYWGVNVVLLTIALFVIPLLRPVIHHRSTFAFIVSMYVIGYKFFKDYVMFRITFSRRLAGL